MYDSICVALPIAILAIAARFINIKAMNTMFFAAKPPAPVSQPAQPQAPRWVLFRICNWVFSFMFLLSFYSVVSTYNRQHRFLKLDAIICGLTMSYLIGFFGVSSIAEEAEKAAARAATAAVAAATAATAASASAASAKQEDTKQCDAASSSASASSDALTVASSACPDTCKHQSSAEGSEAVVAKAEPPMPSWQGDSGSSEWLLLFSGAFVFPVLLMLIAHEPTTVTTWELAHAVPRFLMQSVLSPVASALVSANSTLSSIALVLTGAIGYKWLFGPRRDGKLDSHDFNTNDAEQEKARAATYPAPYPNGWYKLADSCDVKRGQVIEVKALGQVFAVFRTDTKEAKACVIDAFCPHMGANIAIGGTVKGDCVECPFHLWQFNGEGKVTSIPYATKIPSVAKTRSWAVHEYINMICIYYDAEGPCEPPYMPLPQPEVDSGLYPYRGSWNSRDIKMHVQEFAENSADFQHFQPLHGQMCVPWTDLKIPGLTIQHAAQWIPQKEEGRKHIAFFKDHAYLKFLGRRIPKTDADATITFMGPGGICYFRFDIPDLGQILLVQTHTPLKPALQRTQFRWYAERRIPRFLVSYVVGNWITQWKNDIMVWENKIFCRKPMVVKGDGPILGLRRWFRQFYSEASSKAAAEDEQQELSW